MNNLGPDSTSQINGKKIPRRTFLKVSAAALGLLALKGTEALIPAGVDIYFT